MGRRYKGSFLTSTAPVTTANTSIAAGLWSMDQQMQLQGACLWPKGVTPPGQQVFSGGCYTWIVPVGVTSISMVAVGRGGSGQGPNQGYYCYYCGCNYPYVFYVNYNMNGSGGAGGGLAYKNNISVTPGASYTVRANSSVSRICGISSAIAYAGAGTSGGGYGSSGCAASNGGTGQQGDVYCYTVGGFQTFTWPSFWGNAGGSGGAAGYSGTGGYGGLYGPGTAGSGGGGGGSGGATYGSYCGYSYSGGGVGLLGAGASGAGGAFSNNGSPGSGGSGAQYGGGQGGAAAVRIMWPGTTRTYPSNAGDV